MIYAVSLKKKKSSRFGALQFFHSNVKNHESRETNCAKYIDTVAKLWADKKEINILVYVYL